MSIGRLSIGETAKEVINRAIIELQERWDSISDFTLSLLSLTSQGAWQTALGVPPAVNVRTLLTADRTYLVNTSTGNDSNDGIALPFKTIQKGVDAASALDRATFNVTISVAAGTYGEAVVLKDSPGTQPITITGSGITTAIINNPGTAGTLAAIRKDGAGTVWQVGGFKLTQSGTGYGIWANNGADIRCTSAMSYGAVNIAYAQLFASNDARILITPPYTIAGGGRSHMLTWQGRIEGVVAGNVSNIGAITFNRFIEAQQVGVLDVQRIKFSAAGITSPSSYVATSNAVIMNGGRGDSAIPGTTPFLATGGRII